MKGIGISGFGGAEALQLRDWPVPEPGPGEVRVRIAMAGVNYIDVYMRSGQYAKSQTYQTPLPMLLGMEASGTVDAVGAEVTGIAVGDRVAYCLSRGSYAPYAVVPAWKLVPVPHGVSWEVATALQLQGSTAHYLSHSLFPLHAGHTCLVHAGARGVGQLLIQLAKARGAHLLATVGSEDKAQIAAACGADHTILYRSIDFKPAVRSLTDGLGVGVVYDSVGKDTVHQSIRCLKLRGTCVMFGASSGQVEGIAPLELAEAGSVFFTRPHLADYMQPQEVRQRAADLFALVAAGRLRVAIDRSFRLADTAQAHRYIEGRNTRGKLLLDVEADADLQRDAE